MYALSLWRMASAYLRRLGPESLRRRLVNLVVYIVPDANLGRLRDVIDTLDEASRAVYSQRQTALEKGEEGDMEGVMAGKDILSIMCKTRRFSSETRKLTLYSESQRPHYAWGQSLRKRAPCSAVVSVLSYSRCPRFIMLV